VGRLAEKYGRPKRKAFDETIDLLYALTSFEHFDLLAGEAHGPAEVAPLVQRLARAALGLEVG
jgi:hypothetical protein